MKYFCVLVPILFSLEGICQPAQTLPLWPDRVPGQQEAKKEAVFRPSEDKVTRICQVTDPLLRVYVPRPDNDLKTGIIVCPGGGYGILAIDLEGTEIAQWLSEQGYTAFVLQYRVPDKPLQALQDLQRALRLVKKQMPELRKTGVLGFSAGAHLSARAATTFTDPAYSPVDSIDRNSCRPDFAVLIYPAFLDRGVRNSLSPEVKITPETPPFYIFATADDFHGNSALVMTQALRLHNIPVDLHFLAAGGHGYGMRPGNPAAEKWPLEVKEWLKRIISLPL